MKHRLREMALILALAGVASIPGRTLAGEDSTYRWFLFGVPWYEHPCSRDNLALFGAYAHWDTAENRRNYEVSKRDPSQCARLFPMSAVNR